LADNTRQLQWIMTLKGYLDALLPDFVGGDLLWYPDPTDDRVRRAPDVLVALGRPKGHRGSYKQWEEDGVAPQVVFEIRSPSNTGPEMARKRAFYEHHGVQEYYEYDPERNILQGWVRGGDQLIEIARMAGWQSPLLAIRFHPGEPELRIAHPDGAPFHTFIENRQRAEAEHQRAEAEHQRAEQEARRAAQAHRHAESEQRRAAQADAHAEQERERAERLAGRLRALGLDPEQE